MARRSWGALTVLVLSVACVSRQDAPAPPPTAVAPTLTVERLAQALPSGLNDRQGWASDILSTLDQLELPPTLQNVASVLAVLEQESGFSPNPSVPGLSQLVKTRLDAYTSRLGPLGEPLAKKLLEGKAPGTTNTFYQRIDLLKTERDLDRLFRDILRYYQDQFPVTMVAAGILGEAFTSRSFEDLNPITTAGSMQVSVRYATQLAIEKGRDPSQVREEIYTRRGGLYYGVSRLLSYNANYDNPVYRFADYNAGFYSSRNAAMQAQLGELLKQEVVPDGDLLLYDKEGKALERDSNTLRAFLQWRSRFAPDLSEARVRRDLHDEKTLSFEQTETWTRFRKSYQAQTGKRPDFAHLPRVSITSPKMKTDRTTAWFARSVQKRYQRFYARLEAILKGEVPPA